MARTYSISGSLITVNGDPFDEGKDDFLEFDLEDAACEPIAAAAVVSITATLRSPDTGDIIGARDEQDVKDTNGGTVSDGVFRLDLSGNADLIAAGTRTMQARELTLIVTHSVNKVIPIIVRFELRCFTDVLA
jgi:hypothetical protein